MGLTRDERRARRRRVLRSAVALGRDLFPEDNGKRREFLAQFMADHIDIPGIGELGERRIWGLLFELIEDLTDGVPDGQ